MYNRRRDQYEYKASSKACAGCALREQCTKSKDGRTLKRHMRQEALDSMLAAATSIQAKRDIRTRQHLSERSFARSTRYGYKRARWRRLWRMEIQDYLIAAVQNITIIANHSGRKPAESKMQAVLKKKIHVKQWVCFISDSLFKISSSKFSPAYE